MQFIVRDWRDVSTSKVYFKGYSKDDFNKDLNSQNWRFVLKLGSFNEAWDGFKTILQSCIDKHAPLIEKTIRGKDTPWLTSDIKEKIRERDYYLRRNPEVS